MRCVSAGWCCCTGHNPRAELGDCGRALSGDMRVRITRWRCAGLSNIVGVDTAALKPGTEWRSAYRTEAKAWKHLYGRAWQRLRAAHLAAHPLCVECLADNRVTPASVVDHIVPHKGDAALFNDPRNLQSLCKPHHDKDKQAIERGRGRPGCDADGIPRSHLHHWTNTSTKP